jgi:hypothetical protein
VIKKRNGDQENLETLAIIALPPKPKLCFSSKSIFFNMHANYCIQTPIKEKKKSKVSRNYYFFSWLIS